MSSLLVFNRVYRLDNRDTVSYVGIFYRLCEELPPQGRQSAKLFLKSSELRLPQPLTLVSFRPFPPFPV
jgi:hypothetical protein